MRKPHYVPTSQQGIAEVDFSRWLDIDGVGMERAGESLLDMKVLRLAVDTKPNDWPLKAWINLWFETLDEVK